MTIKYGSIDPSQPKPRKVRAKHLIKHDPVGASDTDSLSDEELKKFSRKRLLDLAKQNRAPSVAKAAAQELWERVEPKKERPESQIITSEAVRIADIYDAVFAPAVEARNEMLMSLLNKCPHCGKELAQ